MPKPHVPSIVQLCEHVFIDEEGCWICTIKGDTGKGYAKINGQLAHRIAYSFWVGQIPKTGNKRLVLHKCDKRRCVKPTCLYVGSYHRNNLDACERHRWQYREDHWTNRLNELVPKGEDHSLAKLTNTQAHEIRELYKTGKYSQRKLEAIYHVSHNQIGMIVRNKAYKEA